MTEFKPTFSQDDPARVMHEIRDSITTKRTRAPLTDHNGRPLPMDQQSEAYINHVNGL
jgi:hypothetical protein